MGGRRTASFYQVPGLRQVVDIGLGTVVTGDPSPTGQWPLRRESQGQFIPVEEGENKEGRVGILQEERLGQDERKHSRRTGVCTGTEAQGVQRDHEAAGEAGDADRQDTGLRGPQRGLGVLFPGR